MSASPSARLAALPPNLFAVAFGTAGLALSWQAAEPLLGTPSLVPDVLFLLGAAVWCVLVAGTLLRAVRLPRSFAAELRDPVLAPFYGVPAVVAVVFAAGLHPHAPATARVLLLVALVAVVLHGGWLTGQWIAGQGELAQVHPAWFLPTVAGGLLGANVAAELGYQTIGWLSFGIGVVSWSQLGPVILGRLLTGPALPAALVPTLAIEVAPPAVAGNAYFALRGGPDDPVMLVLAGFCVLGVVAQVRLAPVFLRLPFTSGAWAFTFSYAAVATFALHWIARERPGAERGLAWVVLAAITSFVLVIALQSVRAIRAGRFILVAPAPAPVTGALSRMGGARADDARGDARDRPRTPAPHGRDGAR